MQISRVAVTGLAAISGLGTSAEQVWQNALEAQNGIVDLGTVRQENWPISYAGYSHDFSLSEELLSLREHDRYDRFIHFALHAGHEAMMDAGVDNTTYPAHRIGCIMGVGMGGFPYTEKYHQTFLEKGGRRVSPFFIPSIIPNMATGLLSIQKGIKGSNYAVASACASSGHAIANAAMEIQLGHQDIVITGGSEAVVTGFTSTGFTNMKALSRNPEASQASRPFDQDRDGFVMGEGAGILILENYEKAKARGARIYAELVSYASNADAHHITAPHPEGAGAAQCMQLAIQRAGINPDQIDYINAHGTSTPLGDIAETQAIKSVFDKHAYKLCVSSTKSMTGHLLGAASGIESFFCIKTLSEQIAPPTRNLDNPAEGCDLDYIPNKARKGTYEYVLNNSFGFGGTNSSLIFKKV